jgi:photosystem II stability/assembly factor-like uncharacterized protein
MKWIFTRRHAVIAVMAAGLTVGGCLFDEGSLQRGVSAEPEDAVVGLRMDVSSVKSLLAKSSVISLNRVVIVFTSSANDTIRDTLTASTTPALSATATASQTLEKFYSLKTSRAWKAVVSVRDFRDSLTHRDSATTGTLRFGDTANISLTLTPRFVMYRARFLDIPDSVGSATPGSIKQKLQLNRLVFKIDGVTVRDSSASPGYFAAGTHALDYDYVTSGSHTIQMLAYGPMGTWDVTNPLYSGSKTVNISAGGNDTTVTPAVGWQGPTTGVQGVTVTLGRGGVVSGANAFPGTTGLPPAATALDLTKNGYNHITFNTTSTGWIVGDNGVVLKTTNTGSNWNIISTNTDINLNAVSNVDANNAWIVGDSGTILQDSGGIVVSRTGSLSTTESFRDFDFKTNTGWAVGTGGTIYQSTTLGSTSPTWTLQASGTTETLHSIVAFGTSSAIVVGNGGVCRLYNGTSWATVATGTTRNLRGVTCQSSSSCWAVGDSGTILSYNGTSWSSMTTPTTRNLRDINLQSTTNIVAVGDSGTVLKWNGTSWALGTSNTTNTLNAIANFSANNAWTVGALGTIRYSTNGGTIFSAQQLTLADFYGVHFPSSSRGFAVGAGGFMARYSSTSRSWSFINSRTTVNLNATFFADNNTGWAVGAAGRIIKTANGGNGWTSQSTTGDTLTGVYFVSTTTGWVVGRNGTIRKTTDGSTWNAVTSGTTNPLAGIYMRSSNLIWVVGDSSVTGQRGIIRKTTDGGATWTAQASGVTSALTAVQFLSDSLGWAVGSNGVILKTTNGGSNWSSQASGSGNNLQGVYFLDANKGFAVGAGGKILKTTNGGASWKPQYLGATPNLNSVGFAGTVLGWTVGSNGTLLSFNP